MSDPSLLFSGGECYHTLQGNWKRLVGSFLRFGSGSFGTQDMGLFACAWGTCPRLLIQLFELLVGTLDFGSHLVDGLCWRKSLWCLSRVFMHHPSHASSDGVSG